MEAVCVESFEKIIKLLVEKGYTYIHDPDNKPELEIQGKIVKIKIDAIKNLTMDVLLEINKIKPIREIEFWSIGGEIVFVFEK